MAIDLLYSYGAAISITNTETSLGIAGGTTVGVPVARTDIGLFSLFLDGITNMAKGDEYFLRVYEKAVSGGAVREVFQTKIRNAQSEMIIIPDLILGVGWDITLQRISATSRAWDWGLRRIYSPASSIEVDYATGSAVSITNSETSLATTGGTTTGVPQTIRDAGIYQLFLDGVTNMAKGDEYLLKIYEFANNSTSRRVVYQTKLRNTQSEMFVTPPITLGLGWDITFQRISATSRAFDWSIRRIY